MKPKEKKNLYEQILLFRRSQLRNMIDEENEALEEKEDQLRFFVNSEERELAKKKEKQNKKKSKNWSKMYHLHTDTVFENRQKSFIQNYEFCQFFENLEFAVKQCYQTGHF